MSCEICSRAAEFQFSDQGQRIRGRGTRDALDGVALQVNRAGHLVETCPLADRAGAGLRLLKVFMAALLGEFGLKFGIKLLLGKRLPDDAKSPAVRAPAVR